MRRLYWILMICAVSAYSRAEAPSHQHADHGMLLLGSQEIFASHIVNKVPHNWQVELQVRFSDEVREQYLEEKLNYPDEKLVLVLQHLDLASIKSATSLTGFIVRVDANGKKTKVIPDVRLAKA